MAKPQPPEQRQESEAAGQIAERHRRQQGTGRGPSSEHGEKDGKRYERNGERAIGLRSRALRETEEGKREDGRSDRRGGNPVYEAGKPPRRARLGAVGGLHHRAVAGGPLRTVLMRRREPEVGARNHDDEGAE